MVYLYVTMITAYLILWVLSRKEEEKGPFRKMASYLLRKQRNLQRSIRGGKRNWKKDLYQRQLGEKLQILQPSIAADQQVREHYLAQYSLILMVVFVGTLLCLGAWVSAHGSPLLREGNLIGRKSYGLGDTPIELSAQIAGEEEEIFEYLVEERIYTAEEAEALYEEAVGILTDVILGQNESLEDVQQDLELVTSLEGYPFAISWDSSSYALVNTDGAVNNEELTESEVVMLTAQFRYEQWSWDYQLYAKVNPVVYSDRELLRRQVEELIRTQAEKTKYEEVMVLPENVGEKPIVWREIIADSSGYFLVLILFAAGVLYWGHEKEIEQKLERRKRELLLDYPEIVNKLTLYIGAGMTIRNAFYKMGEDYKKQSREKRRYIYMKKLS